MVVSMMILADTTGTIISLVIGALFVGSWILSALASAKTKKRRPAEGAASWQDILRELSGAASGQQRVTPQPPPIPVPPVRQQPQQRQQQRQQQPQRGRRPKGRKQRPSEVQPVVSAKPVLEVAQVVHSAVIPAATAPPSSPGGRPAIASLLTRENLRNQIVLNEILQPPVALRGDSRT